MSISATAPPGRLDPPLPRPRTHGVRWADPRFTGGVLALAALAFVSYAVHDGLPVASAARQMMVLLVIQLLPGVLLWRWIRPRDGWLVEDLACGFGAGLALSVPAQVLGGMTDSPLLSAAVPIGVAVALLATPHTRRRIRAARWTPTPWWLPVAIAIAGLGAVGQLAAYFRQNQLSWHGVGRPQVDQAFQLALTEQLRQRGPTSWPMLQGQSLDYHWFAHAWMAQLAAVADVPTPQVVERFAPAVLVVCVAAAIASLALRFSNSPAAACGAVFVAMLVGNAMFWDVPGNGLPLNPLSPTLAPSIPVLLTLYAVLLIRLRTERTAVSAVAVFVLSIAAAGAKGSATPLVVAGMAPAVLAAALTARDRLRAAIIDFLLVGAGLLACLKLVFHGSADALTVNPRAAAGFSWPVAAVGGSTSTLVLLAGGVFLVLWGLSKAVLGVLLLRPGDRLGRRDPAVWLLIGSVVAGACAPALFVQPGLSQNYFRIQAIPVAAVLSGVGAHLWLRRIPWRRTLGAVGVAAAAAYLAFRVPAQVVPVGHHQVVRPYLLLLAGLGLVSAGGVVAARVRARRLRWRAVAGGVATTILLTGFWSAADGLRHVSQPAAAAATAPGAVTQGGLDAAAYIGRHAARDAVVMTDRHCRTPRPVRGVCDSRWFLVAAYSGRQMLVEGWGYSPPITSNYPKGRTSITAPFYDPGLLRLNDGFYRHPRRAAAIRLWDMGVRFVYVDKLTSPGVHFGRLAQLQYQNHFASVWKLIRP